MPAEREPTRYERELMIGLHLNSLKELEEYLKRPDDPNLAQRSGPAYGQYELERRIEEQDYPELKPCGYRWGRFQGWTMIVVGLPFFLASPFMRSGTMLILGTWHLVAGAGLVSRKKYAVVLLFIETILATAVAFREPTFPGWAVILFCGIPAALYYPKRWNELR